MIEEQKEEEPEPDPGPPVQTALKGPASGGGMTVAPGNSRPNLGPTGMSTKAKWSAYAGVVKARISDAIRGNARTRNASFNIVVRIWIDGTGRINRAVLSGTTGDAAVDAALRDQILNGLQIQQAPPDGMVMPINIRIIERRP